MATWEIRENDPSESTPEPTRSGPSRVPASLPEPASIESDEAKRAAILENARLAVEFDPVVAFNESDDTQAGLLWQKALRLSPSLEVFEALLRGETVPASRLDPTWRRAYGL